MIKEQKQVLVMQLYNDIKFANQSAKVSEKHEEGLSKEHYQISAFYWFLKTNESLTNEEIREILKSNNRFSFLRKLDYNISNLFEELKKYGPDYIENIYEQTKSGNKFIEIKEERKSLIAELTEKIAHEKITGSREKDVIVGGSYQRIRRTMGHPLKVSKNEYDQLVALSKFLGVPPEITQEDLNELLETKFSAFGFLRKVNNILPDFLLEIRDHGPQSVACYYANRKQTIKEIDRALP